MARVDRTFAREWLRDGTWLFLGMSAYGPRWWLVATVACWMGRAFWRT